MVEELVLPEREAERDALDVLVPLVTFLVVGHQPRDHTFDPSERLLYDVCADQAFSRKTD